jgi:tetratricopeptide (TPR) repeat protein
MMAYFFQHEFKKGIAAWRAWVKKGISLVLFLLILFSFPGRVFSAAGDALFTADAAFNAKQYQTARELYRSAFVNSKEPSEAARTLLGVAKSEYYLKNYYEAGLNLKRFFKAHPDSAFAGEAHLLWGQVFLNIQKYKEAEEQFDFVKGPFQDKATIGKAELAFIRGEPDKAEQLLSKIDRKTYEENSRVLYLRAMILSTQGKHDQAIKTINRIPDQALKDENIAVSKAIIFYNARKFSEAKNMLIAIVSSPSARVEEINAKKTLLKIYEVENNQDESLRIALDLLNFDSADELKLKIISIYESKGDLSSAFRYISYLRDQKTRSDEIEKRFRKLIEERNPKADEYVTKYFIYLGADSPYTIELAKYLDKKENKQQAERLLQKAAKGSNGAEASLALAELLIGEKKYSQARKAVLPITTDAKYSGRASLIMYQLLEREGRSAEAAEYRVRAIKALEIQKDYSRVGDLYVSAGNNAEAIKNYLRASEKGDIASTVKAADIYYITGNHDKAKAYYKKALARGVKDSGADLQWADYQYGKLTKNNEYLKKAEKGGGETSEAASLMRTDK